MRSRADQSCDTTSSVMPRTATTRTRAPSAAAATTAAARRRPALARAINQGVWVVTHRDHKKLNVFDTSVPSAYLEWGPPLLPIIAPNVFHRISASIAGMFIGLLVSCIGIENPGGVPRFTRMPSSENIAKVKSSPFSSSRCAA